MKAIVFAVATVLMTACTSNTKPITAAQQNARARQSCIDNAQRHANDNGMPSAMMAMGCPRQ